MHSAARIPTPCFISHLGLCPLLYFIFVPWFVVSFLTKIVYSDVVASFCNLCCKYVLILQPIFDSRIHAVPTEGFQSKIECAWQFKLDSKRAIKLKSKIQPRNWWIINMHHRKASSCLEIKNAIKNSAERSTKKTSMGDLQSCGRFAEKILSADHLTRPYIIQEPAYVTNSASYKVACRCFPGSIEDPGESNKSDGKVRCRDRD